MGRSLVPAACCLLLLTAACGGKQTETEHLLIQWAQSLNTHLATDIAGGNAYPWELAEIDPLLRPGLSFDDAWGNPLHYRRVHDGKYDIASSGPDGRIGTEDDVVLSNAMLYQPDKVYSVRPASGLVPQGPNGAIDEAVEGEDDDETGDDPGGYDSFDD